MIAAVGRPKSTLSNEERYERHKQDMAARSRQKSASGREIGELPPVRDPELRANCESDLRLFLETCFPAAFRLGWCDDHLVLIG